MVAVIGRATATSGVSAGRTGVAGALAPGSTSGGTIVVLNGLRGLAIALVVWCHFDAFSAAGNGSVDGTVSLAAPMPGLRFLAQNGAMGVDLFFVLSGFLLFLPYARALLSSATEAYPWPSAHAFYVRRCRRILPVYAVVLALLLGTTAVIAHARQLSGTGFAWQDGLLDALLLFNHSASANALVAGSNPLIGTWDGPLWSLAVEWQFYLVLPLLAWLVARAARGSSRHVAACLVMLVALGLAVRTLAAWTHYALGITDPMTAPGLLGLVCRVLYGTRGSYLEVFALGMLAAMAYVWGIERGRWTPKVRRWLGCGLLLGALLLGLAICGWNLASGRFVDPNGFYFADARRHGTWAVSWAIAGDAAGGLASAALLLGVLCLPDAWLGGRVFTFYPLCWLGLISYSLYLWHWSILEALLRATPQLVTIGGMLLTLGLVLSWSAVLYRLVERPFLARPHRQRLMR